MTKTLMGRLRLASMILLALMASLSFTGIYALHRVATGTDRVMASFSKLDRVQELRIALGRVLVAPNHYLIFGNPAQADSFINDMAELRRRYQAASELVDDTRLHIASRGIDMLEAHGSAVFHLRAPLDKQVGQGLIRRLDDLVQLTTHDLDRLLAETRADAIKAVNTANELEQDVQLTVVVLSAVVLAVALFGVLFFARRVTRRLGKLHAAVGQLAEGDMKTRVRLGRRDEIGQIGASFNRMVVELESARAKLLDAERLTAIGQMTVTVKHEMNNPIHGIMMATELLGKNATDELSEPVREALEMIGESCEQLREVIERVTQASEATVTQYVGDIQMIDIHREPDPAAE